jgi:hypothetical protein
MLLLICGVASESLTVTGKVAVPLDVGVPDSRPDADKLRPDGTLVADQMYGVTPPVALKVSE